MGFVLNPLTGQFDLVGTSGGGGGSGTVTSVGLSLPSIFNVTTSVVTTSGVLTAVLVTEPANTVFAGPVSGANAIPTFRSLVAADIPVLPYLSNALTSGHLFVGNASNIATNVALTGDASITNAGLLTVNSVGGATSTEIGFLTGATSNIQTQIDDISGDIVGTPNTFAGYDVTGKLETIPNWFFNPDAQHNNGFTFSNTIDLVPDPGSDNFYGVNNLHTDIVPSASTTKQHPLILNASVAIDPTNTGFDIASVHLLDGFNEFSGSGTLGNYSNINFFFKPDGSGKVTDYDAARLDMSLEGTATIDNISGLHIGVGALSGTTITNGVVAFVTDGAIDTPMITGGYEGIVVNPQLSSTMHYMSAFNNESNYTSTFNLPGGINVFQDSGNLAAGGIAQNYTGFGSFSHIDGTLNGFTSFQASPQLNGSLGFTSMFQSNPSLQASYVNTGGFQAFSDNTQMQTGSTLDNYTSFNSNPTFNGTISTSFTGLSIDPQNPNAPVQSLTGINVNFSQFSTISYLPQGLNINQGIIQQNATLDTQYVVPQSVYGINNIGGEIHVSAGFPINAGQFGFGNNIGVALFAEDDILIDSSGADLGFSSVGFVTQVDIAASKTVHTFNLMAAGAGISGGSGNITNANLFRALGFLPEGGTLNITNLIAFNADPLLDAIGATNLWGIYVGATTADNFFKKNVVIGGSTGHPTGAYALDVTGDSTTSGNVTVATLTPDTVVIADGTSTLASSVVTTTELSYVSGVTSSIQSQINALSIGTEKVELFTLTSTDITNGFITLSNTPINLNRTVLLVQSAPNQFYGNDFIVTGAQLGWTGLSLDGLLASGDNLTVLHN